MGGYNPLYADKFNKIFGAKKREQYIPPPLLHVEENKVFVLDFTIFPLARCDICFISPGGSLYSPKE